MVEGKRRDLPIVITLHGGSGMPIPFAVGCRGVFPTFTEQFIMVYWDQLGCGINDYEIADSFTVDSYVEMTCDLVRFIKKDFSQNRIYLCGMSWGSVLSIKTASTLPKLINGVVVWGQITKNLFFNQEVYETLHKAGLSEKKMRRIRTLTPDGFEPKELQFFTGCIRKYTNGYLNKNGKKLSVGKILLGILRSPDYSLKDVKAIIINGSAKSTKIWSELLAIDLQPLLQDVTIPYHILQGDTDIVTSTMQIREVVEKSNNPNLSYQIIENSGHIPGAEGMDVVLGALKKITDEGSI